MESSGVEYNNVFASSHNRPTPANHWVAEVNSDVVCTDNYNPENCGQVACNVDEDPT